MEINIKNIITASVAAFVAMVLAMFLVAGAIINPIMERDMHGHYKITASEWSSRTGPSCRR